MAFDDAKKMEQLALIILALTLRVDEDKKPGAKPCWKVREIASGINSFRILLVFWLDSDACQAIPSS